MRENNMHRAFICLELCVLCFIVLFDESYGDDPWYEKCAPTNCGGVHISFPFYFPDKQDPFCGYPGFELVSCSLSNATLLQLGNKSVMIKEIFYGNRSLQVYDPAASISQANSCYTGLSNTTRPLEPFELADSVKMLSLFYNCSNVLPADLSGRKFGCDANDRDKEILPVYEEDENFKIASENCNITVQAPVEWIGYEEMRIMGLQNVLRRGFVLNWKASDCRECVDSGGHCGYNRSSLHFKCFCRDRPHSRSCKYGKNHSLLIIVTAVSGGVVILFVSLLISIIIWQRKERIKRDYLSRNISKLDIEGGGTYFGIPVFSYTDLKVATDNFNVSKELGDGGFGTVYHGKLEDGREVAVKRMYDHNSRRMEQYMNEIKILTSLRHPNLVSLYGCTSRRSKELLLVYEYIPNGTVADHLHGERAQKAPLSWAVRMKIAIETADALAYLHKSDIIHRDVKTDNILLDQNFCVKVADFGLSRLFPTDVTHVSTAPQGTPGYVDPEYHQCYQLTDKSDVYSFGVVLIELVSSMPAVDISRDRHHINLANLAVNKIQMRAFDDLIDSSLGYNSDAEVTRRAVLVAELAFQCLQLEKDLRPSMDTVLNTLKEIQDEDESSFQKEKHGTGNRSAIEKIPPSPETDDTILLKNKKFQSSPNAVTDMWLSSSTASSSVG